MGFLGNFLGLRRPSTPALERREMTAITRPALPILAVEAATALPPCWLEAAALTDVGLVRTNNEDNVRLLPDPDSGVALALLADGMGGHASGEVASAMALESMMESYQQRGPGDPLGNVIADAVTRANLAVWNHAQERPESTGMGTTLCALAFDAQGVFFSWVGDSRIYRLHERELTLLTRDDTMVNHLLQEGLLTQEQADNHPDGHVLSQALGTHEALQKVHVQQLCKPVDLGDVFLLTSDGVHDVLSIEAMAGILTTENVHQASLDLVEAAKNAGSTDNLSAVVIRLTEPKDRKTPPASTRF